MTEQEFREIMAESKRETDKALRQLSKQMGELGNKFGSFAEGMALPSMETVLYRDFGIDAIFPRAKARRNGQTLEIDVLAYDNGSRNEVYIVEVKSHLTAEGIAQILKTIAEFPKFFPTLANRTIYGIVAAVDIPDNMKKAVLKKGLYLAHISDETFKLQVPRNFQPKAFNTNGSSNDAPKNGHAAKPAKKESEIDMNKRMNYQDEIKLEIKKLTTRRHFFKECGVGLGSIALSSLLNQAALAQQRRRVAVAQPAKPAIKANNPLAPKPPPFKAKAKRVIYLFQAGAPSQLETFDYKPGLAKYNGKPCPPDLLKGQTLAFIKPDAALYATELKFSKHGQSGAEISEAMPNLAKIADDITIIRSMMTDAVNHAPGQIFMNTGSVQFGRPSFGAWVTYGLGCETQELPAFVVLSSAGGTSGGAGNWGCGFLPTIYQGVPFRRTGEPILSLSNPRGITREMQRQTLDALKELNEHHLDVTGDPEIATRINSFEMAYRMQESAPELMDLTKESKETLALYGAEPGKNSYANNCLLARRMIERGVRFVQLFHEAWDHHSEVRKGVLSQSKQTDQATAALIKDLKQRGLLDDTIVIWGGEFGRTPMVESDPEANRSFGRDHHNKAFSMFVAGGGFKPGMTLGQTDELGFNAAEDPVHVHDLHATVLQLLGFNHEKLTYRFQGRDFRLTDVHGLIVEKLFA